MPHRYFSNDISGARIYLNEADSRHFCVVMRAKPGEQTLVCDGQGRDYVCRALVCSPVRCELEILSIQDSVSEPSLRVTLYAGYPKGDRLEWVIQKATELGAVEIVPFFSRFCVVTPKNEQQKQARYQRIALEAAKQAGRGIIPQVRLPLSFQEMLKEAAAFEQALFLYEQGGTALHTHFSSSTRAAALISGSEGGFSQDEAHAAAQAGCHIIGLGPRILRCETAPITALAVMMAETGNLQ